MHGVPCVWRGGGRKLLGVGATVGISPCTDKSAGKAEGEKPPPPGAGCRTDQMGAARTQGQEGHGRPAWVAGGRHGAARRPRGRKESRDGRGECGGPGGRATGRRGRDQRSIPGVGGGWQNTLRFGGGCGCIWGSCVRSKGRFGRGGTQGGGEGGAKRPRGKFVAEASEGALRWGGRPPMLKRADSARETGAPEEPAECPVQRGQGTPLPPWRREERGGC